MLSKNVKIKINLEVGDVEMWETRRVFQVNVGNLSFGFPQSVISTSLSFISYLPPKEIQNHYIVGWGSPPYRIFPKEKMTGLKENLPNPSEPAMGKLPTSGYKSSRERLMDYIPLYFLPHRRYKNEKFHRH